MVAVLAVIMARLVVQHCILATTVRQYGSRPTSDLLGVDYFVPVPADTEFPRLAGRMELFLRFFSTGLRVPTRVMITVSHLDADHNELALIYRHRLELPGTSTPEPRVHDRTVKLANLSFPGTGLYCVRVLRRARRAWDYRRAWKIAKVEYFSVQRV